MMTNACNLSKLLRRFVLKVSLAPEVFSLRYVRKVEKFHLFKWWSLHEIKGNEQKKPHCVAQRANCPYQFSFMVNVADDTFSSVKSINSMTYYIVMKCWYALIFHPPRNLIWLKKWVQLFSMKLCIYACWLAQPSNWQIWSHNIFLGTLHFSA